MSKGNNDMPDDTNASRPKSIGSEAGLLITPAPPSSTIKSSANFIRSGTGGVAKPPLAEATKATQSSDRSVGNVWSQRQQQRSQLERQRAAASADDASSYTSSSTGSEKQPEHPPQKQHYQSAPQQRHRVSGQQLNDEEDSSVGAGSSSSSAQGREQAQAARSTASTVVAETSVSATGRKVIHRLVRTTNVTLQQQQQQQLQPPDHTSGDHESTHDTTQDKVGQTSLDLGNTQTDSPQASNQRSDQNADLNAITQRTEGSPSAEHLPHTAVEGQPSFTSPLTGPLDDPHREDLVAFKSALSNLRRPTQPSPPTLPPLSRMSALDSENATASQTHSATSQATTIGGAFGMGIGLGLGLSNSTSSHINNAGPGLENWGLSSLSAVLAETVIASATRQDAQPGGFQPVYNVAGSESFANPDPKPTNSPAAAAAAVMAEVAIAHASKSHDSDASLNPGSSLNASPSGSTGVFSTMPGTIQTSAGHTSYSKGSPDSAISRLQERTLTHELTSFTPESDAYVSAFTNALLSQASLRRTESVADAVAVVESAASNAAAIAVAQGGPSRFPVTASTSNTESISVPPPANEGPSVLANSLQAPPFIPSHMLGSKPTIPGVPLSFQYPAQQPPFSDHSLARSSQSSLVDLNHQMQQLSIHSGYPPQIGQPYPHVGYDDTNSGFVMNEGEVDEPQVDNYFSHPIHAGTEVPEGEGFSDPDDEGLEEDDQYFGEPAEYQGFNPGMIPPPMLHQGMHLHTSFMPSQHGIPDPSHRLPGAIPPTYPGMPLGLDHPTTGLPMPTCGESISHPVSRDHANVIPGAPGMRFPVRSPGGSVLPTASNPFLQYPDGESDIIPDQENYGMDALVPGREGQDSDDYSDYQDFGLTDSNTPAWAHMNGGNSHPGIMGHLHAHMRQPFSEGVDEEYGEGTETESGHGQLYDYGYQDQYTAQYDTPGFVSSMAMRPLGGLDPSPSLSMPQSSFQSLPHPSEAGALQLPLKQSPRDTTQAYQSPHPQLGLLEPHSLPRGGLGAQSLRSAGPPPYHAVPSDFDPVTGLFSPRARTGLNAPESGLSSGHSLASSQISGTATYSPQAGAQASSSHLNNFMSQGAMSHSVYSGLLPSGLSSASQHSSKPTQKLTVTNPSYLSADTLGPGALGGSLLTQGAKEHVPQPPRGAAGGTQDLNSCIPSNPSYSNSQPTFGGGLAQAMQPNAVPQISSHSQVPVRPGGSTPTLRDSATVNSAHGGGGAGAASRPGALPASSHSNYFSAGKPPHIPGAQQGQQSQPLQAPQPPQGGGLSGAGSGASPLPTSATSSPTHPSQPLPSPHSLPQRSLPATANMSPNTAARYRPRKPQPGDVIPGMRIPGSKEAAANAQGSDVSGVPLPPATTLGNGSTTSTSGSKSGGGEGGGPPTLVRSAEVPQPPGSARGSHHSAKSGSGSHQTTNHLGPSSHHGSRPSTSYGAPANPSHGSKGKDHYGTHGRPNSHRGGLPPHSASATGSAAQAVSPVTEQQGSSQTAAGSGNTSHNSDQTSSQRTSQQSRSETSQSEGPHHGGSSRGRGGYQRYHSSRRPPKQSGPQ